MTKYEGLSHKNRAMYKLVSRTFWLTVGMFATATVLLLNDKITPEVWGNVTEWVLTAYAGKSIGEKLVWTKDDV